MLLLNALFIFGGQAIRLLLVTFMTVLRLWALYGRISQNGLRDRFPVDLLVFLLVMYWFLSSGHNLSKRTLEVTLVI